MSSRHFAHENLLTSIEHIWKESLYLVKDIIKLFSLEVRLAGKSLAMIIILAISVILLLFSSWLSFLGVIIIWLQHHISLILSLLLVSALNLFIAIIVIYYITKLSSNLQFHETRKQLEGGSEEHETFT